MASASRDRRSVALIAGTTAGRGAKRFCRCCRRRSDLKIPMKSSGADREPAGQSRPSSALLRGRLSLAAAVVSVLLTLLLHLAAAASSTAYRETHTDDAVVLEGKEQTRDLDKKKLVPKWTKREQIKVVSSKFKFSKFKLNKKNKKMPKCGLQSASSRCH